MKKSIEIVFESVSLSTASAKLTSRGTCVKVCQEKSMWNFFNFPHIFWTMVTFSPPAPPGQRISPGKRPCTCIQCHCSGLYHFMQSEICFTAQYHSSYSRGQNNGILPYSAIFSGFEGVMRSPVDADRPPDMKLRLSMIQRLLYMF